MRFGRFVRRSDKYCLDARDGVLGGRFRCWEKQELVLIRKTNNFLIIEIHSDHVRIELLGVSLPILKRTKA